MNHVSPEEWAESLVRARPERPGAPWSVELVGLGLERIVVYTDDNATLVKHKAKLIREYLAALIRQASQPGNENVSVPNHPA